MSQRRSHCRRQFQLSGYKPEQKSTLSNQIASLGGVYFENEHFLPESTHIVCKQPSRSEKFLGGLATGKWLLTTKYILDSYQHGRWLREELYEWGPKWKECVPGNTDAQSYLAAPSRWRKRISDTGQGPFTGWKVALFVEPVKKAVYKRLLRLGDADIIEVQLPIKRLKDVALRLTHVFTEDRHAKQVEGLARLGVLCLKPLYIGAFLLSDPSPSPKEFNLHPNLRDARNNIASQPLTSTPLVSAPVASKPGPGRSSRSSTDRATSNGTEKLVSKRSVTMSEAIKESQGKTAKTEVKTPTDEACVSSFFTPIGRSGTPVNNPVTPVKTCSTPVMSLNQEMKESKHSITPAPMTPSRSKKPLVTHFKGNTSSPNRGSAKKGGKKKLDSTNNKSITDFFSRTPRAKKELEEKLSLADLGSTPLKAPPVVGSDNESVSSQSPQPIVIQPITEDEIMQVTSQNGHTAPLVNLTNDNKKAVLSSPAKVSGRRKSRRLDSVKMTPEKYLKMLGKRRKQLPSNETSAATSSSSSSITPAAASLNNDEDDDDDIVITKYIPSPNKHRKTASVSSTCVGRPGNPVQMQKLDGATNVTGAGDTEIISIKANPVRLPPVQTSKSESAIEAVKGPGIINGSTSLTCTSRVNTVNSKYAESRGLKRKLDSAMVHSAMKKIKLDEQKTPSQFRMRLPSCPISEKFKSETNVRMPFASVMSSLVEAPMEENKVGVGVDLVLLILSTKHYPSTRILRILLQKGFLDAQSASDTDRVYDCLHQILLLHPPVTPVLQQMYLDALQLQEGRDSGAGEHWDIFINALSTLVGGGDNAQAVYSNIKLFKFLVAVFQTDFQCASAGPLTKLRRTLISQLIWPAGQVGIFNTRCQHLLKQFGDLLQINEEDLQPQWNVTKRELIALVLSVVTMIGEVCYLAGKKSRPCLLEETPQNAVILARELAFRLRDVESNALLEAILCSIHSPWLLIIVIEIVLSDYDGALIKPGEDQTNVITLQKIVRQYMFMLPPGKNSNETILSTSTRTSANSSVCNTPKKIRVPLTPSKQIVIATPLSSSQRKKVADVNKKNMKGETALHRACIQNKVAKVKELLATPGIDVNMQDNGGWTPLHEASNHGHVQCVKELLNYKPANTIMSYFRTKEKGGGVNLAVAAEDGTTPLHDAVMNNHVEVAMLILEKGGEKLLQLKMNGTVPEDIAFTVEMKDALNAFKNRQNTDATPANLRMKLHFFSESQLQDPDDSDINFSQLSQTSTYSDPDLVPSDDLYREVLGSEGQSIFSEELCLRLLLLIQTLCQAYFNFYKLNLVALTLKEGGDDAPDHLQSQGHMSREGQQDSTSDELRKSVRNAISEMDQATSSKENSENSQVKRLLEDLKVCQKIKYHLQDFKTHLLKISGMSNLDFCKARLVALESMFRV